MNVSSGLAFVPLPISPVYCATKAGLHSFTESLRVQLKNTKVRVFELAPPATQTELLDDFNSEDMKGVSIMKVEDMRSEEHTSELQSLTNLVCRLLLEKKK